MNSYKDFWSKKELETYIFLLCANADAIESASELNLIKSKVDIKTFEKIYREFSEDTEEDRFEKIEDAINKHDYSHMELGQLRKEMEEIFMSDSKMSMMESNIKRIMNNMLY
ncbi:hypothetical protein V8G61_06220 [Gaetbulibacter sp. M240]|uniref:hypothetical protein n=1 Tax=Gaetbulibacter sp. M240 TaxID=3126511 RepID=UPI00374EB649